MAWLHADFFICGGKVSWGKGFYRRLGNANSVDNSASVIEELVG
jgi:hypothetical protein